MVLDNPLTVEEFEFMERWINDPAATNPSDEWPRLRLLLVKYFDWQLKSLKAIVGDAGVVALQGRQMYGQSLK